MKTLSKQSRSRGTFTGAFAYAAMLVTNNLTIAWMIHSGWVHFMLWSDSWVLAAVSVVTFVKALRETDSESMHLLAGFWIWILIGSIGFFLINFVWPLSGQVRHAFNTITSLMVYFSPFSSLVVWLIRHVQRVNRI
ncbi:hypothetical protein [Pantoea ananatis]|uniref:hypothetical protein n=1 Tax=Pantoea ananas TaxID=553 RepID=UPI000D8B777E|nr:hypothetical protein [Pantoea ananatis]PXV97586.1 hypothetical protein C7422_11256 [Pantoea ananatis]